MASLVRKTLFADSIDSLSGLSAPQQRSTARVDSLAMVYEKKRPTQNNKRRRGKKDKWESFANKTSSVLMDLGNHMGNIAPKPQKKKQSFKVTSDSLAQLEDHAAIKTTKTFDEGGVLDSLASLSLQPKVPIARGRSSNAEKVSTTNIGLTSLFGGSDFDPPRSKINGKKGKEGLLGGICSLFVGDEFSTKKPNSKTGIVQKNESNFGGLMGLMGVTADDFPHQRNKALGKRDAKSGSMSSPTARRPFDSKQAKSRNSSKYNSTFEGNGALRSSNLESPRVKSRPVEKRSDSLSHVDFAGVLGQVEPPPQDMGDSEMDIDDDESSASSFLHRKRGKELSPRVQSGAKRLDRKKTPEKFSSTQNVADFGRASFGLNIPAASSSICSTSLEADEIEGVPFQIEIQNDQDDHCSLSINPAIVNCGRPWEEIAEDQTFGDQSDDNCSESAHSIPREILTSSSMKDSSLECTGIFSSLSLSIGGEANYLVSTNTGNAKEDEGKTNRKSNSFDIVTENVSDSKDASEASEPRPCQGRPRKSKREATETIFKDMSSDEKTATSQTKPRRGRPRKTKSETKVSDSKDMPSEEAKTNTRRSHRARAPPDRYEPPTDNRQTAVEDMDSNVSIDESIKHMDDIGKTSDMSEQIAQKKEKTLHGLPKDVSLARRSTRTRSTTDRFGSSVADQSEGEDELDHPSASAKTHLEAKCISRMITKSLPPPPKVPAPASSSNGWTVTQVAQLKKAHSMINPGSKTFWNDVAVNVDEKNAEECRSQWFSRLQTPQRQKLNAKTKMDVDTGGGGAEADNDDDDDDDIFNSTPMRGLDLQGNQTSFFDKPSSQLDLGSAIKTNNDENAVFNEELAGETPLQHLRLLPVRGYKSYVRGMKRDLSKNHKQSKGRKAPPKPKQKTTVPRLLTEKVCDADVQMNVRLTPGGTVKVKGNSGADEDDFWDEMYCQEED